MCPQNDTLRIAFFTDGLYPLHMGGMQRHSTELIREMALLPVKITVFYNGKGTEEEKAVMRRYLDVGENVEFFSVRFPTGIWYPAHYIFRSWIFSKRLYAMYTNMGRFDFIYAQGFTGWYAVTRKTHEAHIGVNLHGLNMFQPVRGFKERIQQFLLRIPARSCLKRADVVFSLGGKLTDITRSLVPEKKIVEIPSGIQSHWLSHSPTPAHIPLKFLFVGRNDRVKALPELISAFKRLCADSANRAELHVVGHVPQQSGNYPIVYYGEIRDDDRMKEIYRDCDVLICPSFSEGMPLVIFEGMACGLAVIASNTGAIPIQIDDTCGVLIRPGNEDDMYMAMRGLIHADSEKLHAMRLEATKRIKQRFLWPEIARLTIDAIKNDVTGKG